MLKKTGHPIGEPIIDEFTPGEKFMQSVADFKAQKRINNRESGGNNYDYPNDYKMIRKVESFLSEINKDSLTPQQERKAYYMKQQLEAIIKDYENKEGLINKAKMLLIELNKI